MPRRQHPWSKASSKTLAKLAEGFSVDPEWRAPRGIWVRISRELEAATDEYHSAQACRQHFIEQLRPGISLKPMEPWEDDILIEARANHLSFAHISRTLLSHRSERTLVNRVRSPAFKRYLRAKQFIESLEAEERLTLTPRPPPLPLPLWSSPSDHHCRNES